MPTATHAPPRTGAYCCAPLSFVPAADAASAFALAFVEPCFFSSCFALLLSCFAAEAAAGAEAAGAEACANTEAEANAIAAVATEAMIFFIVFP
ncbi:hypothetical protein X962_5828 [Burkholderia pseudomallei MSHR7343]|nr:hypothetical protein X962_5828 [Burkholderia pseudomallei MSHR7343]KGS76725.1 hypothetical protein X942_4938 [Burkholderia pseudomallei MSHR5596]KGS78305.1 hypothetical protein X947_4670 [Burkholderia pseudomallei MSHR7334]